MRAAYWIAGAAIAASMCGAGNSNAGEVITSLDSPSVGIGMICNTPEQAQQFLDLRSNGRSAPEAMNEVNKQADNPHACGVAAIAFTRDKTLNLHPVENRLLEIVRVNVVAGFDGSGWKEMPPTVQYAVMEGGDGDAI
jgi:hypothetical protein